MFVFGFFGDDPQSVFFLPMTPCSLFVERGILRKINIGVQKIQYLFTNFLSMAKELVYVCGKCTAAGQLNLSFTEMQLMLLDMGITS
jgi:hypothetical protein